MANEDVWDWSTTPASNNFAAPFGAPENHARSDVNDITRQLMAEIAKLIRDDLPWLEIPREATITKLSDTQFRIASAGSPGIDYRPWFEDGRQAKVVGASTVYGRITSSTYSDPNTDVTLSVDGGGVIPGALTSAHVNVLDVDSGYPLSSTLADAATREPEMGDNFVRDGSFMRFDALTRISTTAGGTSSPDGWVVDATSPKIGLNQLLFSANGQISTADAYLNSATPSSVEGQIRALEGERLYLSAHIKYSGSAPGALVQIGYDWRDAGGFSISVDLKAAFAPTTGYVKYEHLTAAAPATTVYAIPLLRVLTGSPSDTDYFFDAIDGKPFKEVPPAVASAATITVSPEASVISLTGSTAVDNITATHAGHILTILHTATAQLQHGTGNLLLDGGAHGPNTTGDTIMLLCNGTSWFELSRSVN